MRRIQIPKCTCCKTQNAGFESERFPTLRLCYLCLNKFTNWLILELGANESNPLLYALAPEESHWSDRRRIWVTRENSVASEFFVYARVDK